MCLKVFATYEIYINTGTYVHT